MPVIESAISSDPSLAVIAIEVDRFQLQKCRFRCQAEDGTDFAFSLDEPLSSGDCVFRTATHRYELRQRSEKVLRVPLPGSSVEAARLGWQIGNLHQPADVRDTFLLVADDPALRRLLTNLRLDYTTVTEVFRPPPHSSFTPHQHVPGIEYDHSHFFSVGHPTG